MEHWFARARGRGHPAVTPAEGLTRCPRETDNGRLIVLAVVLLALIVLFSVVIAVSTVDGRHRTNRRHRELIDRLIAEMDPAIEYDARHENFTAEMPQSGERMNRDNLRAMQEVFPEGLPPYGCADWSAQATSGLPSPCATATAQSATASSSSRVPWRQDLEKTRYYAEKFEAPPWRASGSSGWMRLGVGPASG